MLSVADIMACLEQSFPQSLAEEWDNVGLQVGSACLPCRAIMTCLTVTQDVVDYATEMGVDLIIAHHPLIFTPLKAIILQQPVGRIISKLLAHQISLFVAHTNIDKACGGLNDWLAETLQLQEPGILETREGEAGGYGRIGCLADEVTLTSLVRWVGKALGIETVRFIGDQDKPIRKVAVCSGSGSHLWPLALEQGADALITGDLKYHIAIEVENTPLALIDAGHFGTEAIFASRLAVWVGKEAQKQQWPLRVIAYKGETDPLAAVWKGV